MKLNESEYFEIDVSIEGTLVPGRKSYFDARIGQYQPGEHPGVENLKVTWRGMDITDKLNPGERKMFEERLLDEIDSEDLYE